MVNGSKLSENSPLIHKLVRRIAQAQGGQSLVETALVLLFLFPLTFGIIDFSRGIYTASVVSAAAQEGARAGIIDESDIEGAIHSKMIGLDMAQADVNIDTTQPEIVEVNISYDFTFITPLITAFSDGIELTGSASMVKQ